MFYNAMNPIHLTRGSDILAVVNAGHPKTIPVTSASKLAVETFKGNFPDFPVDGVGANLVFQTETGNYILGAIRMNPAITRDKTGLNIDFANQISTTVGGTLVDSMKSKSLLEATLDTIAFKMFYDRASNQEPLKQLFDVLQQDSGWDTRICVHADSWKEKGETKTMCFITTVKWIKCTDSEKNVLDSALKTIMKEQVALNPRARVSDFRFQQLHPIVISSIDSYFKKELEKALHAHIKYPGEVAVTFNDLSITALSRAGSYDKLVGAEFIQQAFIIASYVQNALEVAEQVRLTVKVSN